MSDDTQPRYAWVPGTAQQGYAAPAKVGLRWLMAVPASARQVWTDRKMTDGMAGYPLPRGVVNVYPRSKDGGVSGAATLVLWPTLSLLARAAREPSAPTCVVAGPSASEEDAARGWAIEMGAVNLATGEVEPDPVTPETRETIAGIVQVGYNGWSRSSHGGKAIERHRAELAADPGFTPGLIVGSTIALGNGTGGVDDLLRLLSGM